MLEEGYVKIYRSLLKWEWYDDINTKVLFLHLLLTVNHHDKQWHGVLVKRGSRISSYGKLASETGLSVKSVRTAKISTEGRRNGRRGAVKGQTRGSQGATK